MVVVVNPTVLQGHNSYWGQLFPGLIGAFGEKLLGNMFPSGQDRYYNALAENANEGRKYRTELYQDSKLRDQDARLGQPQQGYSQESVQYPTAADYTTGQVQSDQQNWYERPFSPTLQSRSSTGQFPPQTQQQQRVQPGSQPMPTPTQQRGQENYWYNQNKSVAPRGASAQPQTQQRQYQQSQPQEQPSPVQGGVQPQAQQGAEVIPDYMGMIKPQQRVISEEEQAAFEEFQTQRILSNPNPVIPPEVGQKYLTDRHRVVLATLSNMTYGPVDDKSLARIAFSDNQMKDFIDAGAMQYGVSSNLIDMGLVNSTVNVSALMNKQASGMPLTTEEKELMVKEQDKVNARLASMSNPERAYFYTMMFGADGKSGFVPQAVVGGFLYRQQEQNYALEKKKDETMNYQINTNKEIAMKGLSVELQKILSVERMTTAQIEEARRQFDLNIGYMRDKLSSDRSYQILSIAVSKYTIDKQAQIQSQAAAVGVKMQQAQIALGIYGVDSQTLGRRAMELQTYNKAIEDAAENLDNISTKMKDPLLTSEEKALILSREYKPAKKYYDDLIVEFKTKRESWKTDGTEQTFDQILRGIQMNTSTQGLSLSPDELEPFVPVGWKNVNYKGIAQVYLQQNRIPSDQEFLSDMTEYGTKHGLPELDPQDYRVSRLRQLVVDEINYQSNQVQPVFGITGMDSQSPPPSPTVEKPVDTGKKTPPPATGKGSPTGQTTYKLPTDKDIQAYKNSHVFDDADDYIKSIPGSGKFTLEQAASIKQMYGQPIATLGSPTKKPVVSQVGQQQGQQKWDTRIDKYGSDLRGYFWTIGIPYSANDFIQQYTRKTGSVIPQEEADLLRKHFETLRKQYQEDWAKKPSPIPVVKYVK